jgi:hypothetical protein
MDAIFIFFGHPGSVRCLRRDSPALPAGRTHPAASSHTPARVLCEAPRVLVAAASCACRQSRSRWLQPGPSAAGPTRPSAALQPAGRDARAEAPSLCAQCAAPPWPRWPCSVRADRHTKEDDLFTRMLLVCSLHSFFVLIPIRFIPVALVS